MRGGPSAASHPLAARKRVRMTTRSAMRLAGRRGFTPRPGMMSPGRSGPACPACPRPRWRRARGRCSPKPRKSPGWGSSPCLIPADRGGVPVGAAGRGLPGAAAGRAASGRLPGPRRDMGGRRRPHPAGLPPRAGPRRHRACPPSRAAPRRGRVPAARPRGRHPSGHAVTSRQTASHLRAVSEGSVLGGRVGGAVLAAIRTGIPATQEELAERAGVSVTTVQAWERGRKPLVNMPFPACGTCAATLRPPGPTRASWRCGTGRWTRT